MDLVISADPIARTARANEYIRDTIHQTEDMKRKRQQLKLLVIPKKMRAKLGARLPIKTATILTEQNPRFTKKANRSPQPDIMSHLPNKLVHMVLKRLPNADKVALALTCKYHMAMIESVRKLPDKRPPHDKVHATCSLHTASSVGCLQSSSSATPASSFFHPLRTVHGREIPKFGTRSW